MPEAQAVSDFLCPGCGVMLAPAASGEIKTRCPNCRWKGDVYLFQRLPIDASTAESALPEDATCIHHPTKKATAICAGTGDYICSLCTIDLNGQTYSAHYLDHGGKETMGKAFAKSIPRPDGQIRLYLIALIIIPYVNAVLAATVFLWLPHAFILYFRALKMRREDKVFARLMSPASVIVLPVLLCLVGIAWLIGVTCLIVYWRRI